LGVGCHLTLVDGQPILPAAHVPSLIEGDGRFRRSWKPFIVSCLLGRISLLEVERELTAQIDRIRRRLGVTPDAPRRPQTRSRVPADFRPS